MPDLAHSLYGRDLGHFSIVAGLWGLDFDAPDAKVGLKRLVHSLLDRELIKTQYRELPDDAKKALEHLAANHGRMPWAQFSRRYGLIREVGPGRRDRERPYLNPESTSEILWYRAWIGRAFVDLIGGAEEFVYIPSDLLELAGLQTTHEVYQLGRPATQAERAVIWLANDRILDHTCTLLAGLRIGLKDAQIEDFISELSYPLPVAIEFLKHLLVDTGVLDDQYIPVPDVTRQFLEAGRSEALTGLVQTWLASPEINDLWMVPGLVAEGGWRNDPVKTRQLALELIRGASDQYKGSAASEELPWISLSSFVSAVKQHEPDFQRPAGDYDSWFIRQAGSDEFLRGFENWDKVEGALLHYLIAGPLHWLGIVDLGTHASSHQDGLLQTASPEIGAFRLSLMADELLRGIPPGKAATESEPVQVNTEGDIWLSALCPRAVRYQIARFCSWEGLRDGDYYYVVTPMSLTHAQGQGLKVSQLLALLRRYAQNIPPMLVKALERWDTSGSEAQFEHVLLLRLKNPEILQALRGGRAARFIYEVISPTAAIIKPGSVKGLKSALAEMGYLVNVDFEMGESAG